MVYHSRRTFLAMSSACLTTMAFAQTAPDDDSTIEIERNMTTVLLMNYQVLRSKRLLIRPTHRNFYLFSIHVLDMLGWSLFFENTRKILAYPRIHYE